MIHLVACQLGLLRERMLPVKRSMNLAVCENVNHQGHEGTRRKCLRPKAFVVLRVLGGSGRCILKPTNYRHTGWIRRWRSGRSHFRNPVHARLNFNTPPSGDMMVTE